VEITGSAVFNDCPGATPVSTASSRDCGSIPSGGRHCDRVQRGHRDRESLPDAGNVPGSIDATTGAFVASGSGNGAPCLPSAPRPAWPAATGAAMDETSANQCGGTTDDGVIGYFDNRTTTPDTSEPDGEQFLRHHRRGGWHVVSRLTAPPTASTPVTMANRAWLSTRPTVQANTGFDAEAGDAPTSRSTAWSTTTH